nr:PREDICTED: TIMELESS-interacting protein-like [Latimeria chalumnae]|eukprot:XP_014348037.1 PREDICTED: TIMELESS-interacting protein-like [Latimeria chalumnae]
MEEAPMIQKKELQGQIDIQIFLSERGIPALQNVLENLSLKGQGHEAEDLVCLLQSVESWARELYPDKEFEDVVNNIEEFGALKEMQLFSSVESPGIYNHEENRRDCGQQTQGALTNMLQLCTKW